MTESSKEIMPEVETPGPDGSGSLRIVFLGTPPAAVPCLRALAASRHRVVGVITRPDRRRGRGSRHDPSPVKAAAMELGLRVEHDLAALSDPGMEADLGVVVAYGRIIPPSVLERLPMINVHFSRLPRWRGAAPVERAILAGDTTTGVDIIEVAEGLDEGDVYASREVGIERHESAVQLTERLAELGAELLIETLDGGLPEARPQVGDTVYAAKLENHERRLDFVESAEALSRRVRIGRAWAEFRGRRLMVEQAKPTAGHGPPGALVRTDDGWAVGTGDGLLLLQRVKPEGKRAMRAADWANGAGPEEGEQLG